MIPTLTVLLVLAAFVTVILSAMSPARCPLWIPVLLIIIVQLMAVYPNK